MGECTPKSPIEAQTRGQGRSGKGRATCQGKSQVPSWKMNTAMSPKSGLGNYQGTVQIGRGVLAVPQGSGLRVSRGCLGRKTSPRPVPWIHLLWSLRPIFQFQAHDTVVHGTVEALRVNESVNKHQ